MLPTVGGDHPVYRVTAEDYDGVEFTEAMTPEGVVYNQEAGYLSVFRNQNILVYLNSVTHGHGGNRFDEYVYAATFPDAWAQYGWLPTNFRMEFAGLGYISPLELLSEVMPPETEATSSMPNAIVEEDMPPQTQATGHTEATGSMPDSIVEEAVPPETDAEAPPPVQAQATGHYTFFSEVFEC
jgi:hypothetical protein